MNTIQEVAKKRGKKVEEILEPKKVVVTHTTNPEKATESKEWRTH